MVKVGRNLMILYNKKIYLANWLTTWSAKWPTNSLKDNNYAISSNKSNKTRLIDQQNISFLQISTRKWQRNWSTFYHTTWRELVEHWETRRELVINSIPPPTPNHRRFKPSLISQHYKIFKSCSAHLYSMYWW